MKVLDKFEDPRWLGLEKTADGKLKQTRRDETQSAANEWPVSYHGTGLHAGMDIAQHGYSLTKAKRGLYGHGVYTTPDIDVAALYAQSFAYEGKNFAVVIQNRVNPATLQVLSLSLSLCLSLSGCALSRCLSLTHSLGNTPESRCSDHTSR